MGSLKLLKNCEPLVRVQMQKHDAESVPQDPCASETEIAALEHRLPEL
jgi:hypothetical protein